MDSRLLALLTCIACGGALRADADHLRCPTCGAVYPISDGIPVLYTHGEPPEHLRYAGPEGFTSASSPFRRRLRRWWIEPLARRLWHTYLRFDTWVTPVSPADPRYWMRRLQRVLPPSPKAVLDLGGGTGIYRPYLATTRDLYVILEPDETAYAVRTYRRKHQYVVGDGLSALFAPQSYDVIALFEVLEHVRDPFVLMQRCASWLRPNGVLVLSTPQYWPVHGHPSDYFRYTIHGIRLLAESAGLELATGWDMGGPWLLIASAVQNAIPLLNAPLVKQLVANPLVLLARSADALWYGDNIHRSHPDTRGWVAVCRRPLPADTSDA